MKIQTPCLEYWLTLRPEEKLVFELISVTEEHGATHELCSATTNLRSNLNKSNFQSASPSPEPEMLKQVKVKVEII